MMRFRLYPTPAQAQVLGRHCAHSRYVWNLALEQANWWRLHWGPGPGRAERNRQLTEARAAFGWLGEGSVTVQQQALRDFDQALRNFFAGTHLRPRWRKAGVNEGFRQVAVQPHHIERLNRCWGRLWIPKCGWLRFRWTRKVPSDDRGVAHTLALSTGELVHGPGPADAKTSRAARRLSHANRGSNRRRKAKARLAKVKAADADRRKDFVEKTSTDLARRFDIIRIESLNIVSMTRSAKGTVDTPGRNVKAKAGLNRAILAQGWALFARRLADKAGNRVEEVNPAYTSQRCSCCGWVDALSRENQARFVCTRCGYTDNADVNAAKNIAAGHAATARGGLGDVMLPVKHEPQPPLRV